MQPDRPRRRHYPDPRDDCACGRSKLRKSPRCWGCAQALRAKLPRLSRRKPDWRPHPRRERGPGDGEVHEPARRRARTGSGQKVSATALPTWGCMAICECGEGFWGRTREAALLSHGDHAKLAVLEALVTRKGTPWP